MLIAREVAAEVSQSGAPKGSVSFNRAFDSQMNGRYFILAGALCDILFKRGGSYRDITPNGEDQMPYIIQKAMNTHYTLVKRIVTGTTINRVIVKRE